MSPPAAGGTGYRARAAVTAERDATGRTRLTGLRSDGPLALRETPEGVYLVGAAAGPLGGDDLALDLTVGAGARLAVRSAAAMIALPGRGGGSRFAVRAAVGADGRLDFAPEPTVAAAGCDHRSVAEISLARGAVLRWREELVLGRHGEVAGRHVARLDVTVEDRPLLRHELRLDDPAIHGGRAVLGGATAVGGVLLAGPGLHTEPFAGAGLAVLPLAGPGVLVTALAATADELRRKLSYGESLASG
ncbi:urease accessory protein UreD [Actinomadura craniellae]|uniref:Urease accessory protein UreD n=1 Tax=Actinomadura craniellae TaxID=2231787 RepID=A0A365GZ31_9ACTN|nr:urease accessory protein UreD [Actinomadura craniellae]RAY12090.1 urease accessory protein UreD [Actinomadura craniellae]